VHFAMQQVDALLEECRTGKGDAMLRVRPAIVFVDDGPPFVDAVEVPYHENLSSEEIECVRQTLLSLDVPPAQLDPSIATPWRFQPITELYFDDDGALLRQQVSPSRRVVRRAEWFARR
jgi:hypothetical protein